MEVCVQDDGMANFTEALMNSTFSRVYGAYLMPRFGSILKKRIVSATVNRKDTKVGEKDSR